MRRAKLFMKLKCLMKVKTCQNEQMISKPYSEKIEKLKIKKMQEEIIKKWIYFVRMKFVMKKLVTPHSKKYSSN